MANWLRALLAAAVLVATLSFAPSAFAYRNACPKDRHFTCGWVPAPLDYSDPSSKKIKLFVEETRRGPRRHALFFLNGGPGDSATAISEEIRREMRPLRDRYRLVVYDQRGTGASAPLFCDAILAKFNAKRVAECGREIGWKRAFFTTSDSVLDIERLRRLLGYDDVALYGVSYGTWVAQQYARQFPERVSAMILDSAIAPDGIGGYATPNFGAVSRILTELCGGGRCDGITSDPSGDLAAVVARVDSKPIRGWVKLGARLKVKVDSVSLYDNLLIGDFSPALRALFPGAIAAARAGDTLPVKRLIAMSEGGEIEGEAAGLPWTRRPAQGAASAAEAPPDEMEFAESSTALAMTTLCEEVRLPWSQAGSIAPRWKRAKAGVRAVGPAAFSPFSEKTSLGGFELRQCRLWPRTMGVGPEPPLASLTGSQTLILAGRADLRTPLESASEVASVVSGSELVPVPGVGHSVMSAEKCAHRAVRSFAKREPVGDPCGGLSASPVPVTPPPPRSFESIDPPASIPGAKRGRTVVSAVATLLDMRGLATLQREAIGEFAGDGLRGGSFYTVDSKRKRVTVRLDRLAAVAGVRLSGDVIMSAGKKVSLMSGSLQVSGPRATAGWLDLGPGGTIAGKLGGVSVTYSDARLDD